MFEKIGNVTIDSSQWEGEEKYSDGPIEQELLQRLQAGESETEILQKDDRYAMLYHLTRERENILSWYPFTKDMNVLEVGAGCGAITGLLSRACGKVTSVDISLTRSRINAYRHREATNLHLLVANAEDLPEEPRYDIVTLIGVFEYSGLFVQKKDPFLFFLEHYRKMLKPDGHLLIAIENQFGLKYMLGALEDHHWKLNEGLYDYPSGGARTFSRNDLDHLLQEAGFEVRQFAAAYPDYKIPYQIISEHIPESMQCEFSPQPDYGEFAFYSGNVQRAMQTAARHGLGIDLANSFLICAGSKTVNLPYYVKYASARKNCFAVRTELYHEGKVRKVPLCPNSQIGKMLLKGKRLLDAALPSLHIASVQEAGDVLLVEKKHGINLTKLLAQKDSEGQKELFSRYIQLCRSLLLKKTPIEFTKDKAFKAVFGEIISPAMLCVSPAPVDLNLSNIMVDNGQWTLIDTEWVFEFAVPYKYILWRAAFLYGEATGNSQTDLIHLAEITDEENKIFQQMERGFSEYAFGRTSPMVYNRRYYAEGEKTKECQELVASLTKSEALVETINKEKETAWKEYTEKEKQYNQELSQRLQAEETNRQLKVDNEELTRQLDASDTDRATAWQQFAEREAQYNQELNQRLQAEETNRQLKADNEELTRQLDASDTDRATAWQQFAERETQYNQELNQRLQAEETNRQLKADSEELTRQLDASDTDRTTAWQQFVERETQYNQELNQRLEAEEDNRRLKADNEELTREIKAVQEEYTRQLDASNADRTMAWQQFSERETQYNKELTQRLQAEEVNRQLRADNEELTRQLEASNADRTTAWQQFAERETQYNQELNQRLQVEETNRQLTADNEELTRQMKAAEEEYIRQLDASNADRTTAWQQFAKREAQYNQELNQRLQVEETNRQLTADNEELTRQLDASNTDRTTAWQQFAERDIQYNQELTQRLQTEEANRQLTIDNEELTRQMKAAEEEYTRQLNAINADRTTAWQQFSKRETQYNQELNKRLQMEETNRQLSVQNEETARMLEISNADRLAAWEKVKNCEEQLSEARKHQDEQKMQIASLQEELDDTKRLANQYHRHLNEVMTKLDGLEKSLLVRAVEKVKKI